MSVCNVLIVEDDSYILNLLNMSLSKENYQCHEATKGLDALELFYAIQPDVVLLDLGLPDMDGIEVIKRIREYSSTPIIVVSARNDKNEKIRALDLGANDYVSKPFYMDELMARIRVATRMSSKPQTNESAFQKGELKVDFIGRRVFVSDEEIHLTKIEFNLLKLLIEHQGKVLTHNYIQKAIWGYEDESNQNALRVYMAKLRKKIELNMNQYITTEVGVGYRFIE